MGVFFLLWIGVGSYFANEVLDLVAKLVIRRREPYWKLYWAMREQEWESRTGSSYKDGSALTLHGKESIMCSAEALPLKESDDGDWQVENVSGNWITCSNRHDAQILSDAPVVLSQSWSEPPTEDLADKLED